MFMEVWAVNSTPGSKQPEAIKQWRVVARFFNSNGVKSRVMLNETGAMNRIFLQNEFESQETRAVWYTTHRDTDEWNAAFKDFSKSVDMNSFEHYYYYEPPE